MFRRERHRIVFAILEALDAKKLKECGFLFGGGTRIALDLDEFRESHDIDFVCADESGYADLRIASREQGYDSLFSDGESGPIDFPREIRADQYGIRFPAVFEEVPIKVELIREGRIHFEADTKPEWSPVSCLSRLDCYAVKILANSDRWPDRQVLSRDLVDLGAMRSQWGPIPEEAWKKAEGAYKSAARSDLRKALTFFLDNAEHQQRCIQGLSIENAPRILRSISTLYDEV